MLDFANHFGLYAEETAADGSHLGNFPPKPSRISR
jgi:hypothetical protein